VRRGVRCPGKRKLDEALALASEAVAGARKNPEPKILLGAALHTLAIVHRERNEFAASDELYREALALSESMEQQSVWAASMGREFAERLASRGKFEEAADVPRARLAALGDDHPEDSRLTQEALAQVERERAAARSTASSDL
jgi:tetratricopeptide (TPR) repeat protein